MFAAAMAALLACMVLSLVRSVLGPTVFDRVLALNSFGTKTVLLIAVLGFLTGRPDFLDLALVYGLMNFIGTIAVMKFTRFGDLAGMERDLDEESGAEAGG
ncbi:MAG: monovalent cation/H+ antiporter complex subunit F [Planctomycetota bacterium]|jgi:multicomponent Na+:H+ antiporter subunit F|nr:monovalent cation/H+ antiporter complex subunit F [Planctomycetota bacterium]MDP6990543.1 monovalent cation/H+ antiporter complex subunit F [Planctomycetota bacterium]